MSWVWFTVFLAKLRYPRNLQNKCRFKAFAKGSPRGNLSTLNLCKSIFNLFYYYASSCTRCHCYDHCGVVWVSRTARGGLHRSSRPITCAVFGPPIARKSLSPDIVPPTRPWPCHGQADQPWFTSGEDAECHLEGSRRRTTYFCQDKPDTVVVRWHYKATLNDFPVR